MNQLDRRAFRMICRLILDYKGQPRDDRGRFSFGKLGKSPKSSLKKDASRATMSKKEVRRVSSGILTDHPNYEAGSSHCYYYGDHYYGFVVNGPGSYSFSTRIPISELQEVQIDEEND